MPDNNKPKRQSYPRTVLFNIAAQVILLTLLLLGCIPPALSDSSDVDWSEA